MRKANQQKMFDIILQWQQSGLTQKAWCEQNNVAYSSFHYWYKLFRNQRSENTEPTGDNFVQLLVQDGLPGSAWCELSATNGRRIIFHQSLPVEFIRSLLD